MFLRKTVLHSINIQISDAGIMFNIQNNNNISSVKYKNIFHNYVEDCYTTKILV